VRRDAGSEGIMGDHGVRIGRLGEMLSVGDIVVASSGVARLSGRYNGFCGDGHPENASG
jgi:hypothetical protein